MTSYLTIRKRCRWIRWIALVICAVVAVWYGVTRGLIRSERSTVFDFGTVRNEEGILYGLRADWKAGGQWEPYAWTDVTISLHNYNPNHSSSPALLTAVTRVSELEYIFRDQNNNLTEPMKLEFAFRDSETAWKSINSFVDGFDARTRNPGREWETWSAIISFLKSAGIGMIYATMFLLLVAAFTDHRRWSNGLPHTCPECDYDLHGLTANRCPECGYQWDEASDPSTSS